MELSPRYYRLVVKRVLTLLEAGRLPNVTSIVVDQVFGYFAVLTYRSGASRVIHGNDLGLDTAAAVALARSKTDTKFVLRQHGIRVADGFSVALPH